LNYVVFFFIIIIILRVCTTTSRRMQIYETAFCRNDFSLFRGAALCSRPYYFFTNENRKDCLVRTRTNHFIIKHKYDIKNIFVCLLQWLGRVARDELRSIINLSFRFWSICDGFFHHFVIVPESGEKTFLHHVPASIRDEILLSLLSCVISM